VLVLATQHHNADHDDHDAWLFLDLDLSVLAAELAIYVRYSQNIRAEFNWVPEADYRRGRSAVLASFQARENIYRTPALKSVWEARARANLARELAALQDPPFA
jgi:predicted metal-dependent HD superfamily phosphohydrolase